MIHWEGILIMIFLINRMINATDQLQDFWTSTLTLRLKKNKKILNIFMENYSALLKMEIGV